MLSWFKEITKFQWFVIIFNLIYLFIFSYLYFSKGNLEFILYVAVMFFFLILITLLHLKYKFGNLVLLGLSLWGLMHMCGGYVIVGGSVLYGYWIIDGLLRFDQFVHAFGFGFATLFSYEILMHYLGRNKKFLAISVFLVFIGMGLGALNEIVEFIAVLSFPKTGVGGYENTMFDIVFNTIGAIIAVIYINIARKYQKEV